MGQFRSSNKKIKSVTLTTINTTTAAKYYIDVRNGRREIEYLHPDLEPILKRTNGVFVYQEDVMRFLVEIVGISWEESDSIRSAIAKKKHEVIMATFEKIRKSCSARGWSTEAIETICKQIQAFSRYSFNRSHSAAYGELGYITLYLKHHYPLEWWCAVLNNEKDSDKSRAFIAKLGELISQPSLKEPSDRWTIKSDKLAAPISAIKGIGRAAMDELVKKGPFVDTVDFCKRIDHTRVNIGAVSLFIKSRVADDLMDQSIPDYLDRRIAFMAEYLANKKTKTKFKDDLYRLDPVVCFLEEREINSCFNKTLVSVNDVRSRIMSKWPGLRTTGRKSIPLVMGGIQEGSEPTYIISDIKTAEGLLAASPSKDKKFGMFLLFSGSEYSSGVSKKTGRSWERLSIKASDGYNEIECTWWDRQKPLRFNKGSIIYVYGNIVKGWKTPVSFNVNDVQLLELV